MHDGDTGAPGETPARPEKKIAIFGTTPSRMEGPVQDGAGWQRWTIGPGGKDAHNWERLFEVHHVWPEEFKGYLGDLSKETREVWSLAPMPQLMARWRAEHKKSDEDYAKDIPGDWSSNRVVDRQKLEEKYGRTWFSSSISWLIAQALEEGATDIGLWGIDLESGEEYIAQYFGCRYFMDLGRLVGVRFHLPTGCGLLREPRAYPDRYETTQALHMERKQKYASQMLAGVEAETEGVRAAVYRLEGRILAMREHNIAADAIAKIEGEYGQRNSDLIRSIATLNHLRGEIASTEYWRRQYVYNMHDPDRPG